MTQASLRSHAELISNKQRAPGLWICKQGRPCLLR